MDFSFENHGSLWLVRPLTQKAQDFANKYVGDDETQYWGGAIGIEPRYFEDLYFGLKERNFKVDVVKRRERRF